MPYPEEIPILSLKDYRTLIKLGYTKHEAAKKIMKQMEKIRLAKENLEAHARELEIASKQKGSVTNSSFHPMSMRNRKKAQLLAVHRLSTAKSGGATRRRKTRKN